MKPLLAVVAAWALIGTAHAVPISDGSTINFTGNSTFTPTQVNFVTPSDLKLNTGDFAALGTCTDCVTTVTPFTFNPFTAVNDLFTVTNNALTATVDVISEAAAPFINATKTALIISDNVILSLTGKDDTPGLLTLTVNQSTGAISGSFSATGEASSVNVPEPTSMAVLGLGLLGLGLVKHRRRSV